MTALDENTTNGNGAPELGVSGSLLADLRRRAAELRDDDHIDLEVPGWSGRLKARYRALPRERLDAMVERVQRRSTDNTHATADALALALVDLFGVDEHGELQPLFADQPARFDMDLAQALGLQPTERTARGVVMALFGAPNDRAAGLINAQFRTYSEWMNGDVDGSSPAQEVVEQAVGESRAT